LFRNGISTEIPEFAGKKKRPYRHIGRKTRKYTAITGAAGHFKMCAAASAANRIRHPAGAQGQDTPGRLGRHSHHSLRRYRRSGCRRISRRTAIGDGLKGENCK